MPPQVAEEAEKKYKAIITSDLGTQDVGSVSGCTIDDPGEIRRRTVGRMLPGNKVKLLDDNGKEVKEGEPGQLWFRGPHAPAGYYRDPEDTAPVFDKNGWTTTGDIVKSEDGCLWIMGRSKDMIIRGGQNIYPAEIEGILNEHPKVTNVAIVGYPIRRWARGPCAYVVLKVGETFTKDQDGPIPEIEEACRIQAARKARSRQCPSCRRRFRKVDKKVLKTELEKKVAEGK